MYLALCLQLTNHINGIYKIIKTSNILISLPVELLFN